MFRQVKDFLDNWTYESGATAKVLAALTDASLAQRVAPEGRTLGTLAWHVAVTIPEMLTRTGLPLAGAEHGPMPATAAEIAATYDRLAHAVAVAIAAHWTDASLLELHDMYGQQWPNGATLFALVAHQAHHRGQMTVLMRQAGLPVPGVYGPSREEWSAMGLPAEQ